MKFICSLIFLFSIRALATDNSQIYRCSYRVVAPNKDIYVMTGNIIPSDVNHSDNGITYLTLAPNELSKVALEARILFTADGYNPITLHKPGRSVTTLAYSVIELGQEGVLGYTDENGIYYKVHCVPKSATL